MARVKKMNPSKDRKIFRSTANKTHVKNSLHYVPRGGIRI